MHELSFTNWIIHISSVLEWIAAIFVVNKISSYKNYTLLSDTKGIVSKKYGSWIPPYSDRNTFLISPQGRIIYRWISVTPINHAKEVLKVLEKNL